MWSVVIWMKYENYISNKGYKVCILDAAVLLQAEWNKGLHEVWVSIVPHKEVSVGVYVSHWSNALYLKAVRRIMQRDGMPEEAAEKRLAAQISNQKVVDHGNVVFSSQWEYEFTQKQVRVYSREKSYIWFLLGWAGMEGFTG